MIEIFNKPFIEGVKIKKFLTDILGFPKSKARNVYHDMREKYVSEAKSKKVIVFGNQLPTNFTLAYLEAMGVSKELMTPVVK